ncbi:MAG TPA: isochorismate synthase [Acidimicrobiales bacterium]|nr:isochorismate synthase [Acidimicrobiales bacterium]
MTVARTLRGLTVRTVALDRPVDLAAFAGDDGLLYEHDGAGLAGRGVAMRISGRLAELPERVTRALHSISSHDDVGLPGCGPVAMGALPFDPDAEGSMVIPATVVGRAADGTSWMTTVAGWPEETAPMPVERRPPDRFTLDAVRSHEDWCEAVARAVEVIRSGRLDKVVLAREVRVEANRPILPVDVLGRLRTLYPSCRLFSVEGFVGASPEILISRCETTVRSHPLAGTIPRSGNPAADDALAEALLGSQKDRWEHRLVVEEVAAALTPHCEVLEVPEGPSIVPLRNVSHLGTAIVGRLHPDGPDALTLAALLHPTPAVGGTPTREALSLIAELEGLDRGRYAGAVGWVDGNGDGEFAVGIRSAELDGSSARLFAGVGVVADSDPAAELAETQLKLQALLAAVVRP